MKKMKGGEDQNQKNQFKNHRKGFTSQNQIGNSGHSTI